MWSTSLSDSTALTTRMEMRVNERDKSQKQTTCSQRKLYSAAHVCLCRKRTNTKHILPEAESLRMSEAQTDNERHTYLHTMSTVHRSTRLKSAIKRNIVNRNRLAAFDEV